MASKPRRAGLRGAQQADDSEANHSPQTQAVSSDLKWEFLFPEIVFDQKLMLSIAPKLRHRFGGSLEALARMSTHSSLSDVWKPRPRCVKSLFPDSGEVVLVFCQKSQEMGPQVFCSDGDLKYRVKLKS